MELETVDFQSVRSPYREARNKLIGWGVLMAAIYLVYFIVFPLIPTINQSSRVLEIEMMLRHGRRWFAPLYVVGLGALFYAFYRALRIVRELSQKDTEAAGSLRGWARGIGILCSVILIGLYPITALDVVLYVVR